MKYEHSICSQFTRSTQCTAPDSTRSPTAPSSSKPCAPTPSPSSSARNPLLKANPRTTPPISRSSSKTKAHTACSKATSPRPTPTGNLSPTAKRWSSSPARTATSRPSLYAEELSVPTWNYIAIHAYGTLSLIEDDAGKEALLAGLIQANDPAYADQWRSLPDGFRRTMLAGIVGFRIPIARIEGKFKLSQNRPEADRHAVQAAHAAGTPDQQALAEWMQRLTSP